MKKEILIVEDNLNLRAALVKGLEDTGNVKVINHCDSGEDALEFCLKKRPEAILMDVQLAGEMNGIQAAVEIRKEFPRIPVIFYSIQDEDNYFRDFRRSGILSHYAYVRKSNYLLPHMIVPLILDAIGGRSVIDPEIEARVQEVRQMDEQSPMAMLEPNEKEVARMLGEGMTNEQIASKLGFKDKRTISRTNGQIYTTWGLNTTTTDEKIARTRAAIIARTGRMMQWDEDGHAYVLDERGDWQIWEGE
ncbi:MAG: response regulator [Anaerolineales bacterium]|jgi:DNA-binding NarL/FixJ family response regulator